MSPESFECLLLLEIRNEIATKERLVASANQELSQGGWKCD